ncbi:hypothetical protein BDR26DRAFT_1014841 [Obelidium mucronatum]|nr:hypothetical protein BDR26DRAFT_1014841 [Obelidium mucronatum]
MDPTILSILQSIQSQLNSQTQLIDSRLARIDAALAAQQTQLENTSQSTVAIQQDLLSIQIEIASNHQNLVGEISKLSNPHRKFYTRINQVPDETFTQIFSWIHPEGVFKFRRLCRRAKTVLDTKHFATLNLAIHHTSIQKELSNDDDDVPAFPDYPLSSNITFMYAPHSFQFVYAQKYLKSRRHIGWNVNELDEVTNSYADPKAVFPKGLLEVPVESLVSLALYGIRGSIPSNIGSLSSLNVLFLALNGLSGNIPPEIGLLRNLRVLRLDSNRLSGVIPSEIGDLGSLEYLYLDRNELEGSIPPSVWGLLYLKELYLDENRFTGCLPDAIGNLSRLQDFCVSCNQLSGPIPVSIGNMASLSLLYMYDNQFTGPVPREMMNLNNLSDCDLRDNSGLTCDFEIDVLRL